MEYKTFNSFSDLLYLREAWDQFAELQGCNIFFTYDWLSIWWKYYGENRKLLVFIFTDNEQIVAILPVFSEEINCGLLKIEIMKLVGIDFTNTSMTVPIKKGCFKTVMQRFFDYVHKHVPCDLICFGPLTGKINAELSISEEVLDTLSEQWIAKREKVGLETYFQVAASWQKQLAFLSKKQRENIKRSYKKLLNDCESTNSEECLHIREANLENLNDMFTQFVKTHQESWIARGHGGHFNDWLKAREFHQEVAYNQCQRGRLRLFEIMFQGRSVGFEYAYKLGNQYVGILNARQATEQFKNISIGKIIFCEFVKKAISEDVSSINSLSGYFPHKMQMGGRLFVSKMIFFTANKRSSKVKVYLFRKIAWLINIVYSKMWFRNIAPRLPIRKSPLWPYWIKTYILLSDHLNLRIGKGKYFKD